MQPKWLEWAKKIQALSQAGLTYTEGVFDRDRYLQLRDLAAEIMAAYSDTDLSIIKELFQQQAGYPTPKVDVRGVVFKNGEMLLVREKLDGDRWTLPGGWADANDTPAEAVTREVLEETGYPTRATKLLACLDRNKQGHPPFPFHVYKLYFRCELLDETPVPHLHEHETGESRFFREEELPADISTGRVTAAQLHRFFEHFHQPDLPTDFD